VIVPPPAGAPSRILVYGVTGSGKSTPAARISAVTGLPWHGVDDLTWEPGWVAVPADEQRRRLSDFCGRDAWILDSGYGAWIDIPLARVQLIVALDYPRWLSFGRLLRHTVVRLVDGTAICNGNRETLRHTLSRDSLLLWHCRSFGR
jgi:adenylate kinase family enzyme